MHNLNAISPVRQWYLKLNPVERVYKKPLFEVVADAGLVGRIQVWRGDNDSARMSFGGALTTDSGNVKFYASRGDAEAERDRLLCDTEGCARLRFDNGVGHRGFIEWPWREGQLTPPSRGMFRVRRHIMLTETLHDGAYTRFRQRSGWFEQVTDLERDTMDPLAVCNVQVSISETEKITCRVRSIDYLNVDEVVGRSFEVVELQGGDSWTGHIEPIVFGAVLPADVGGPVWLKQEKLDDGGVKWGLTRDLVDAWHQTDWYWDHTIAQLPHLCTTKSPYGGSDDTVLAFARCDTHTPSRVILLARDGSIMDGEVLQIVSKGAELPGGNTRCFVDISVKRLNPATGTETVSEVQYEIPPKFIWGLGMAAAERRGGGGLVYEVMNLVAAEQIVR